MWYLLTLPPWSSSKWLIWWSVRDFSIEKGSSLVLWLYMDTNSSSLTPLLLSSFQNKIQNTQVICQIFYYGKCGHHLWKLKGVKQGHTTPPMSCLGCAACGFDAWPGCFSHTPVCALCHLSGWCEILTDEAWGTNKWTSVFLVSEISLSYSLKGFYESGLVYREVGFLIDMWNHVFKKCDLV